MPKIPKAQPHLSKYRWEEAERDFVNGTEVDGVIKYPTQNDISEKYDIPLGQIKNRSYKYRWSDQRKAAEVERATEIRRERAKNMVGKAVVFDEKVYKTANLGVQLIHDRLNDLFQLVGSEMDPRSLEALKQKWIADGELDPKDFYGSVYHKELSELSKALQQFHDTGRKALGIKDDESPQVHVELHQTNNVTQELNRVDRSRLTGMMSVLGRKNLKLPTAQPLGALPSATEEEEVLEGELVETE